MPYEPTQAGGSGSTLIACEKAGRRARLIELDPKYVDVIVRRWQDWTGKEATRADGTRFEMVSTGADQLPVPVLGDA